MTELTETETESAAPTDNDSNDDEAPCCWLCLAEGPDASGNRFVRDCSCRGSSGYAHLSCIIGYAESAESDTNRVGDTRNAFIACPNCKQLYQNQLRQDLSKARVRFAERDYTMDNAEGVAMHATAVMNRMTLIDAEQQYDRIEGKQICTKLQHILQFTKTDKSRNWAQIQASAHMSIATFQLRMGMRFGYAEWKDCLQTAKEHYEMAVEIYRNEKDDLSASATEKMIAIINARLDGVERQVDPEANLSMERKKYKFYLDNLGQNHITTINAGISYAQALSDLCYTIVAERYVAKLHGISQRAHGENHNCTVKVLTCLKRFRERRVYIKSRPNETFQALRYEESVNNNDDDDDDDQVTQKRLLVLQGPIAIPRNVATEQTFQQDCANVSFAIGTPVIFQGLTVTTTLNDKIGTVKEFDKEMNKYAIYFQEENVVKKALGVEEQFLHILFDLPEEEEK